MKRFQVKCRRCRQWLMSEESIIDCHGNTVQSQDDMATWYCGEITATHLYVSAEQIPPFIVESVVKSNYTQGKVLCPKCQGRLGSFNFVQSTRACSCRQASLPPIHLLVDRLDLLDLQQQQQSNMQVVSPVLRRNYSQHGPTPTMMDIVDRSSGDGKGVYRLEDDRERDRDLDVCANLEDSVGGACRLEENRKEDEDNLNLDPFPRLLTSENLQENRTHVTDTSERDQTERETESVRETERMRRERESHRERREKDRIQRKLPKRAKRERRVKEVTEAERTETRRGGGRNVYCRLEETEVEKNLDQGEIPVQRRYRRTNSSRAQGWQQTQNLSGTCGDEDGEGLSTHGGRFSVEKPHRYQTISAWQREKERKEREAVLEKQKLEEENVLCDHTCPVCMEVMLNPHLTLPCRHNFCEGCLRRLAKVISPQKSDCPMCRQRIARCQQNIELQQEINTLYPAHIRTRQREEKRKRNQHYKNMSLPELGFPHNFLSSIPLRQQRRTITLGASAAVVGRRMIVLALFVVVMFSLSYVGMIMCRLVLSWLAPLYDSLMEVLTGERLWSRFMGVESRALTVSTVFVLYLLCACVVNHFQLFNP